MIGAIFAFVYGIIVLALVNEADSEWLKITGWIAAFWMIAAGALAGWQANKK